MLPLPGISLLERASNLMKKYLLALVGLLFFPLLALAAYDDVSLTTDTRIALTGETLNVSGSTAYVQSIDVTSDSFTATLVPGSGGSSSLKVSSPSLYKFTHSVTPQSGYVDAEVCNSSESSVTFAPLSGQTIQVTVQVNTASVCSGGSSGSSSGGGGGGGGGTTAAPPLAPPVAPPTPPAVPPAAPTMAISAIFTRTLKVGLTVEDVKRLQQLLNADSDTRVAVAGPGSPGKETTTFGVLTQRAVGKFQLKYKVVTSSGDPGYGIVGPKTRAKLQGVFGSAGAATTATQQAQITAIQAEVARLTAILQQMLAAQGH